MKNYLIVKQIIQHIDKLSLGSCTQQFLILLGQIQSAALAWYLYTYAAVENTYFKHRMHCNQYATQNNEYNYK